MIDFQLFTQWRFRALNGQNRLAAALSFMVSCNYDLQDWVLSPGAIDPFLTFDVQGLDDEVGGLNKGYTIYGQTVEAIPQQQDLIVYIDRSREKPKLTSGVLFYPSMEIRLLSHSVNDLNEPSVPVLLDCLQAISQKRAVDERMLSNTSMPAKCSQIFQVICDESIWSHQQCLNFHREYKSSLSKPSDSFKTQYPGYCSESEDKGIVLLITFCKFRLLYVSQPFMFTLCYLDLVQSSKSPSKSSKKVENHQFHDSRRFRNHLMTRFVGFVSYFLLLFA